MLYKAKVAVCSDIRTKHSTQRERHVEFLNVKLWWYGKKPLGFKRLKNKLVKLSKRNDKRVLKGKQAGCISLTQSCDCSM